jgi:hypothetical protein
MNISRRAAWVALVSIAPSAAIAGNTRSTGNSFDFFTGAIARPPTPIPERMPHAVSARRPPIPRARPDSGRGAATRDGYAPLTLVPVAPLE